MLQDHTGSSVTLMVGWEGTFKVLVTNWVRVIKGGCGTHKLTQSLCMQDNQFDEATPTLGLMATPVLGKVRGKQQEEPQPIKWS